MTFNVSMGWKNEAVLKNLETIHKRVDKNTLAVNEEIGPAVVDTAKRYQEGVQGGPHKITGTFQQATHLVAVWAWGFVVGNNTARAKRLEYGFVGKDSLGREYHQPPYPSMRPALWYWKNTWRRMMTRAVARSVFKR